MDRMGKVRVLAVVAAMSIACSAPPQDGNTFSPAPTTKEKPPLDPTAPGASVLCGEEMSPIGQIQPEFYVLSAMNHKLRFYPEFAAEIGIDLVSDCESARAFWTGYDAYLDEHPDFDADEPMPPMPDEELESPSEPSGSLESPKIFNGTPEANNPVVQYVYAFATTGDPSFARYIGNFGSCTGTFIAKNWILTAAHCLSFSAIDQCIRAGISKADCIPDWEYRALYTVRGTHSLGRIPYTLNKVQSRIYVHPNWIGTRPSRNEDLCAAPMTCHDHAIGDQRDLGLIYIGDDRILPGNVDEDNAKRLSIVEPPDTSQALTMWGYGEPGQVITPTGVPVGTLRRSNVKPNFTVNGSVIEATLSPSNTSFPCHGDSGGPLFRSRVSINTNIGPREVDVLVGISSSGPHVLDASGNEICAPPGNQAEPWRWTSVSSRPNRDFILDTIRQWPVRNTLFSCTERRLVSGGVEQGPPLMDECWGKPCRADTCAIGETCSKPGRELANSPRLCSACDTFRNGCDCIVGQCLPIPLP